MTRWTFWVLAIPVALVLILVAVGAGINEPLRGYIERQANRSLTGYHVRIGSVHLHPIGFAVDFYDLVVSQDANPDPPMLRIPQLSASIQWTNLIRGRIVSDWRVLNPTVFIHQQQVEDENRDAVSVTDHGWQGAVQALYPFKINRLEIRSAQFTYADTNPLLKPIRIHGMDVNAENIRNVRSSRGRYPSTIAASGRVFGAGTLHLAGRADFLAEPFAAVDVASRLEQIPLTDLEPVLRHVNLVVREGTASVYGRLEYAPWAKNIHVERIVVQGAQADFVHHPVASRDTEEKVVEGAKDVVTTNKTPNIVWAVDRVEVKDSTVGFVNKGSRPSYRVFLEQTELDLKNLSNHLVEGTSEGSLEGALMGTGQVAASVIFRPETRGADMDLAVRINEASMPSMNDLWRAYGNFDVTAGVFSLFMEVTVRDGAMKGYVKPFFKAIKVYDEDQDDKKGLGRRLYERLVGGLSTLLENKGRDEVATKAEFSGRIDDPRMNNWQAVVHLVQNAFFQAILPGFEGEAGRASG
jgi:hypothetical protein